MKLRITPRSLFLLGLCTVLFSTSLVAADMSAAAKALAKIDDEWSAAALKKDAAKVASYYAEDAIAYPPNAPALIGREAAGKAWAQMLSDPNLVSMSWKTIHAEIATSGEFGLTTGAYEATVKGADGKLATDKGKYVCAWRKGKDGTWKAVHDIWSSDSK